MIAKQLSTDPNSNNIKTQKSIKLPKKGPNHELDLSSLQPSAYHICCLDFRNEVQIITNRKRETSFFGNYQRKGNGIKQCNKQN